MRPFKSEFIARITNSNSGSQILIMRFTGLHIMGRCRLDFISQVSFLTIRQIVIGEVFSLFPIFEQNFNEI